MRIINFILRILLNAYWKIFGGLLLATIWLLVGIIFTLSIIFYDKGLELIKISYFIYKPFKRNCTLTYLNPYISIIWIFTFGLIIGTITTILFLASIISIGGIVLIKQWKNVFYVTLFPFASIIN